MNDSVIMFDRIVASVTSEYQNNKIKTFVLTYCCGQAIVKGDYVEMQA